MSWIVLGAGWLGTKFLNEMKEAEAFSRTKKEDHSDRVQLWRSGQPLPKPIDDKIVLLTFAPDRKNPGSLDQSIENLIPILRENKIKRLFFTSSVSLFHPLEGEVDEDNSPSPESENGKELQNVEMKLLSLPFPVTILRLGGLIGADRNPAKFLSGKEISWHYDSLFNLTHVDHIIEFLQRAEGNLSQIPGVLHLISHLHDMTKGEYYKNQCETLGLALPIFKEEGRKETRQIKTRYHELTKPVLSKEQIREFGLTPR